MIAEALAAQKEGWRFTPSEALTGPSQHLLPENASASASWSQSGRRP